MDEPFATRLRRLRHERGLSQRDLARQAYCSQAMVSRMESGESCSLETARALDLALDAGGVLLEVAPGMASAVPTPYAGEIFMVRIELSDGTAMDVPMDRRSLLTVFGAVGVSISLTPSTATSPTPEVTAAALRSQLVRYAALGQTISTNDVSALMVPHVSMIDSMLRQVPDDRLRRELLVTGSRYCEVLGWMRQDAGDLRGATYWTDRAAEWASAADWPDMVTYTLIRKATIAWYAGNWPMSVDLARAAARAARTPGVRAQALAQAASGYAIMARRTDTDVALGLAADAFDRYRPEAESAEGKGLGFTESPELYLGHMTSSCWLYTGRASDAVPFYERVLSDHATTAKGYPDGYYATQDNRIQARYQSRLALAYARADAPDQAVVAADRALARVERIPSASIAYTLGGIRDALSRWSDRDDVRDITHRVRQLSAK